MSQIRRDDGVQFVVQPYRELLNIKQISALKREIRTLARKQGENICVFKRENGQFEVVFSRESGFLLGETVWNYFNKPKNLIYCGALPEKESILLIIVKEGSVYLDAKVSSSELVEELAGLSTSNAKYDVYVYGNVPVSETAVVGKENSKAEAFVLDKKLINSFKILSAPILSSLLLDNSLQLLPLELALTAPYFRNKFIRPIAYIVGVLLICFVGYLIFSGPSTEQAGNQAAQPKDPYELYNKDLATPAPERQLREMNKLMGSFMALAGWDLNSLGYKDGVYTAKITQTPSGTMEMLQLWAKAYGINIGGGGGTLTIPSTLGNRPVPKNIYNLDQVVSIVMKKLTLVVTKENLKIGTVNNYQQTRSLDLEISFKDFSPLTFDLIGKLLAGFPLHITSINASVTDNLFSGSIKLTIWGN